jgi:predicted Fe-S protein YdhL (DUF1289 family)
MESLIAWFLRAYSIRKSRDKFRKLVAILIFIMLSVSLIVILTTIFSAGIAFSLSLEEIPISHELRGAIACFIDQSGSCTGCNTTSQELQELDRCPEWSEREVTKILQTQAKASSALAAIFLIYAFGVLTHGINLRRHITSYQIDYV